MSEDEIDYAIRETRVEDAPWQWSRYGYRLLVCGKCSKRHPFLYRDIMTKCHECGHPFDKPTGEAN